MLMKKTLLLILIMLGLPFGVLHGASAPSASTADQIKSADALMGRRNFRAALPLYQSAVNKSPDSTILAELYTRIGDCSFQLGLYENAVNSYWKALPLAHADAQPEIRYWIGFCSFLMGKNEQAVKEFLAIPQLHPQAGIWISTAYYWAGRASERLGQKEEAGRYYKKAGGNGRSKQGRYALQKADALKTGR
jgi:tetratricopeptide (TPR) repeat protein